MKTEVEIKYLTKSAKDGVYGYRRKIPVSLRGFFPNNTTEYKKSFFTTDVIEAARLVKLENNMFDVTAKVQRGEVGTAPDDVTAAAKVIAIYNKKVPKVDSSPDDVEVAERLNYEWATDVLTERGYIEYGHDGWTGRPISNLRDPEAVAAWMLLKNKSDYVFDITLYDVMSYYLTANLKKPRNETQKLKVSESVPRLFERLANELPDGILTVADKLDRFEVREILQRLWPNASTRKRVVNTYSAAINYWNEEHARKTIYNVFNKLVKAKEVNKDAVIRRSFTPEELSLYQKSLSAESDIEVRLIGALMIFSGCPNGEAQDLQRNDLKLHDIFPHVIFRNTTLRMFGKDRIERSVPLVGKLLMELREYAEGLNSESVAFFPKHSGKSIDRISTKLAKHITNCRPNDQRLLSPYSARHTFMDRYKAAEIPAEIGKYLVGHKDKESNKVHDKYGTGRPPELFVEHIKKINDTADWGYFETYE